MIDIDDQSLRRFICQCHIENTLGNRNHFLVVESWRDLNAETIGKSGQCSRHGKSPLFDWAIVATIVRALPDLAQKIKLARK